MTGWIVTFILEQRGGSANSGYISSGFFDGEQPFRFTLVVGVGPQPLAGIMLGRILLLWVNRKVRRAP